MISTENRESIYTVEDIMKMLDSCFHDPGPHWDEFYADRTRPMPFFVNVPDDTLRQFFYDHILKPGRVLELGCGNGRNAIFMAQQGCQVDAVDISAKAIEWASDLAAEFKVEVNWLNDSLFNLTPDPESYDIIYDGGCFHHIAPHRRITYVDLVTKALKPNGYYCLYCFIPGTEFSPEDRTDWEVYRRRNLSGGFAFTKEELLRRFEPCGLKLVDFINGKDIPRGADTFGRAFLHTALFQKRML